MENNVDLVSEFFDQHPVSDTPAVKETKPAEVDTTSVDMAKDKIISILTKYDMPDTYANTVFNKIREAYIALSIDDNGVPSDTDLACLTAEISDIIVCYVPTADEADDADVALMDCDIIDAITNKYEIDAAMQPSEETEEEKILADDDDDDDVSSDIWD